MGRGGGGGGGGGGAGQDAPAPVAGLASSSKVEGAVCGQD